MKVKHMGRLLMTLAGWANRCQQDVIVYLQEENKILREELRTGILGIRVSAAQGPVTLPLASLPLLGDVRESPRRTYSSAAWCVAIVT